MSSCVTGKEETTDLKGALRPHRHTVTELEET